MTSNTRPFHRLIMVEIAQQTRGLGPQPVVDCSNHVWRKALATADHNITVTNRILYYITTE